jgi:hypothetical protein
MNFCVEFTAASRDDALRIVLYEENLPGGVRTFICKALQAHPAACAMYVKAVGVFHDEEYELSCADIVVHNVKLRQPRPGTPANG